MHSKPTKINNSKTKETLDKYFHLLSSLGSTRNSTPSSLLLEIYILFDWKISFFHKNWFMDKCKSYQSSDTEIILIKFRLMGDFKDDRKGQTSNSSESVDNKKKIWITGGASKPPANFSFTTQKTAFFDKF